MAHVPEHPMHHVRYGHIASEYFPPAKKPLSTRLSVLWRRRSVLNELLSHSENKVNMLLGALFYHSILLVDTGC